MYLASEKLLLIHPCQGCRLTTVFCSFQNVFPQIAPRNPQLGQGDVSSMFSVAAYSYLVHHTPYLCGQTVPIMSSIFSELWHKLRQKGNATNSVLPVQHTDPSRCLLLRVWGSSRVLLGSSINLLLQDDLHWWLDLWAG